MAKANKQDAVKDEGAIDVPAIHAVRLDRPGVRACGPFKPGVVYRVGEEVAAGVVLTNKEAHRLIMHKGFSELTAAETNPDINSKQEG